MLCEWTIIAPPGNKILIAFSQFETEEFNSETFGGLSNDCGVDYLEIVEKKSEDKEVSQTEKYCKTMPKEFTSIGDLVVIR